MILTYKSSKDEADAVVRQIEAVSGKAVALELDVSDSSTFDAFANAVKAELVAKVAAGEFRLPRE